MANVLDLRRRIRSVKNTRQITKAMKMVSAAKLRRAQERALAARPYAQMITSVLESLTPPRRDLTTQKPATCAIRCLHHAAREARAAGRRQRRQGICRRLQRQHPQDGASSSSPATRDKEIDIEAVGRKGRDLMRRRYPAAVYTRADRRATATTRAGARDAQGRRSRSPATIPACWSSSKPRASSSWPQSIISRYVHEEIDAAYIVYNEFKSVISQRLVVEQLLPLIEDRQSRRLPAPSSRPTEERERAAEAALSAGIDA